MLEHEDAGKTSDSDDPYILTPPPDYTFKRPRLYSFLDSFSQAEEYETECRSGVTVEEDQEDDAEIQGDLLLLGIQAPSESDLESPKTPRCSIPRVIECPDAPSLRSLRSKEMLRQTSLNETKLLMTTQLKRTYSTFLFDKHFEYLREIGRGSSSMVYEARDRRNGTLCAVKVSKQPFFAHEEREKFLREIQSVACLPEHPNVVKYYRGWQQDAHFHIQMELCDGGSLRAYLDTLGGPMEEIQTWSFIEQVASGLEHIHSNGVLHLDIKPENIFLSSEGVLKIGDFGLAVQKQNLWDWEEGDGAYVAPELLKDEDPGTESDMYSFGVMVYEWIAGSRLPPLNREIGPIIQLPPGISETLEGLILALLNMDRTKRPDAHQVLTWKRKEN